MAMPDLSGSLARSALIAAVFCGATARRSRPRFARRSSQYQMTTLPNGLTVVSCEDHSTPIVHLQLWYHVGSKNEKPGRTGFAHLFEHMMFKGSKNVEPEEHTSVIASVGGQSNAYTTDDETVFWETVPAQFLPLVLWLEADRMATLRIDKDTFDQRARGRQGRAADAGRQPAVRPAATRSSTTRPSRCIPTSTRPSAAWQDLEAASVDDVRDFYNTYYVPENATLALVGDFDSAQAMQLVKQYLGRVPKAERPVPRDIPKEPPQTREKRVTLQQPWPLPAVVVAYHITYDGHPDSYPLHIASKVLSDGQSSRIYQKLVYDQQLAVAAFGGANLIEDPNLFYAVAIVQPGQRPEEAVDALIAELDRLKSEPISERELQRAKNQFARDYILGRESNQQKALQLAHAARDPQRHQDRRRRVRHLPEHHGGRRAARRAHLLHAREPPGPHHHAGRRWR